LPLVGAVRIGHCENLKVLIFVENFKNSKFIHLWRENIVGICLVKYSDGKREYLHDAFHESIELEPD